MRPHDLLFVVSLAAAGCAETGHHVYVPTEHASAVLPRSGVPAAEYAVPAAAPEGHVEIATLGVQKLRGGEAPGPHLVLRFVITNNSDADWTFEPATQTLYLPDGSQLVPDLVYGDQPSTAAVRPIPARGQRSFDLLYPVSGPARTFQVAWSVRTSSQLVSDRTDFRRETVEPPYEHYAAYGAYYAPPWWYAPSPLGLYPYGVAWFGPRVVVHPGFARARMLPPRAYAPPRRR